MFIFFAENRANYNKGQIFPFVIAAIVILTIMAMITANLGKVSVIKTDVANAADASALAGVSILSGWLLGMGLTSDTWCGTAVVTVARMVEIFVMGSDSIKVPSFNLDDDDSDSESDNYDDFPDDLVAAVKLYIQHMIKYYLAFRRLDMDNEMAWANTKQTALRAAFQNSGVDERPQPKDKFKNYMAANPGGSYDDYVQVYLSQDANKTGFAQFMEHPITGYGKPLGKIKPGKTSPLIVTSGYGWKQQEDETFQSSFPGTNQYKNYDNYVEAMVYGSKKYPLETLTFAEYFGTAITWILAAIVAIGAYIKYIEDCSSWWCYIISAIYALIDMGVFVGMLYTLPCGFTFSGRNMERYTRENPIAVQVKRHKDNVNLGMWNFQYGNVVGKSGAYTFRDTGEETVEPVFLQSIVGLIGGMLSSPTDTSGWFKTELHLFETELASGYIQ